MLAATCSTKNTFGKRIFLYSIAPRIAYFEYLLVELSENVRLLICFIHITFRSCIIEKFTKAKEKYNYYRHPIPPDTTMDTLKKRWESLATIKAMQSVHHQPELEQRSSELISSNL